MQTHTLIIGSGAAGLAAAIQLHRRGITDVLIATESLAGGTSINTGSDKQTYYKLSLCGADADSVRRMAETYFAGGSMHGDLALAEAANSVRAFMNLVELGIPFPTDEFGQFVVEDVAEPVVFPVVQVYMAVIVDVEVHLVVAAEPAAVDAEVGQLREDVVDRCHRDLHDTAAADFLGHHIGRCVPENHHRLVHLQPLAGRLEAVALEPGTELVQGGHGIVSSCSHRLQR